MSKTHRTVSPKPEVETLLTQLDRGAIRMRGALLVLPFSLAVWGALQFALNFDEGWRRPLNLQWWDAALCVASVAACALLNWRFAVSQGEEEQGRALIRLLRVAEVDPRALLVAVSRLQRLERGTNGRIARQVLSQIEQTGAAARGLLIAHQPEQAAKDNLPRTAQEDTQ